MKGGFTRNNRRVRHDTLPIIITLIFFKFYFLRGFTSFLYSRFPLFEIINQNNLVDFIKLIN